MTPISSRANPHFKAWLRLVDDVSARLSSQQALIYGHHLVEMFVSTAGAPKAFLYSQATPLDMLAPLLATYPKVAQFSLTPSLFSALSQVSNGHDLMAWIDMPQRPPPSDPQCALFIENIQDPGNLGSILRSAALAGVDVVYLSADCTDAWSPRALRGGQGAQCLLPLVRDASADVVCSNFQGIVYATSPQGESLYARDLSHSALFLVGNEGAGLQEQTMRHAHVRLRIPMVDCGRLESLNVATATALCLFERMRQLADGELCKTRRGSE